MNIDQIITCRTSEQCDWNVLTPVTHSAVTSVKEDLLSNAHHLLTPRGSMPGQKSRCESLGFSTFHLSDRKSQGHQGGRTKVCYGSRRSWFDMFLSYRGDLGVLLRLWSIGLATMTGVIILDFQNIFTEVIQLSPQQGHGATHWNLKTYTHTHTHT